MQICTLLVERILARNFGKLGDFKGVVSSYDAVHEECRIDFSADNTYELISFDDILLLLPHHEVTCVLVCRLIVNDIIIRIKFLNDIFSKIV